MPRPTDATKCENCQAWEPQSVTSRLGACRRHAPITGNFPETAKDEWCLQFKAVAALVPVQSSPTGRLTGLPLPIGQAFGQSPVATALGQGAVATAQDLAPAEWGPSPYEDKVDALAKEQISELSDPSHAQQENFYKHAYARIVVKHKAEDEAKQAELSKMLDGVAAPDKARWVAKRMSGWSPEQRSRYTKLMHGDAELAALKKAASDGKLSMQQRVVLGNSMGERRREIADSLGLP